MLKALLTKSSFLRTDKYQKNSISIHILTKVILWSWDVKPNLFIFQLNRHNIKDVENDFKGNFIYFWGNFYFLKGSFMTKIKFFLLTNEKRAAYAGRSFLVVQIYNKIILNPNVKNPHNSEIDSFKAQFVIFIPEKRTFLLCQDTFS